MTNPCSAYGRKGTANLQGFVILLGPFDSVCLTADDARDLAMQLCKAANSADETDQPETVCAADAARETDMRDATANASAVLTKE